MTQYYIAVSNRMYASAMKTLVTMNYSPFDIGYDAFYRRRSSFENNSGAGFATTNVSQNKAAEVKPVERSRVMDLAFLVSSDTECCTEISRCETVPIHVQSTNFGSPNPPKPTDRSILTSANPRETGTENVTDALESQTYIDNNDTRDNYKPSSSEYLHGVSVRMKTTIDLGRDVPRSATRQAPKINCQRTPRLDFEMLEEVFEKIEKVSCQGVIVYACPLCPSEYATKTSFQEHVKSHLAERTFDCHLCSRSFKLEQNLRKHITWHSETSLECHICGKVLTSVAGYKMHMESHSGITYECTICNRELSSISSFEGHMRTHDKNRVYECPFCSKRLKYKSTLKGHMRLHTGEKPYECKICHTKMITSHVLKTHMKKHR